MHTVRFARVIAGILPLVSALAALVFSNGALAAVGLIRPTQQVQPPPVGSSGAAEARHAAERFRVTRDAAEGGDATAQYALAHMYASGSGVSKDEVSAVLWYRRSAEQGLAEAQCNLGVRYWDGVGVAKDEVEAVRWYRKSAQQGNAVAQHNLGVCYDTGRGVSKDEAEAYRWFRKSAMQGYSSAQFYLGSCYANGAGVSKDEVEALLWYRKSAEQGNAAAQCEVGLAYDSGTGVIEDDEEAVKWFRMSADQGFAKAQLNLGLCYESGSGVERDYGEAVKWLRKSAEQGRAIAEYNLGFMYANGRGVPKDDGEAVRWYRKSADQGDADAQNSLGLMYRYGRGVAKDEAEAVKWYHRSALQGARHGQFNLGLMYEMGWGVPKSLSEAFEWYSKSAKQGLADAQFNLGRMYESGEGVSRNEFEAARWYRKSAQQGFAPAQCNLAIMYDVGRGVEADGGEALAWYRKGAAQGDSNAQFGVGRCYWAGRGVDRDAAEAVKWFRKSADQGIAEAQFMIGIAHELGRGARKDLMEALIWYRMSAAQGFGDAKRRFEELMPFLPPDTLERLRRREMAEAARKRFLAGEREAAIEDLRAAVASDPMDAFLHTELARLLRLQGDQPGAVAAAGRAVECDPDNGAAFLELGFARYLQGDTAAALSDLDRALRLDPRSAMAWSLRGDVRRARADYARAIRDYSQAIRRDPSFADAYSGRGLCHVSLGDFLAAREDYRRAAEHLQDALEPVRRIAMMESYLGRLPEAQQVVEAYVESHPDDPRGLLAGSNAAWWTGDRVAYERHLRAVIRSGKDPQSVAEAHQGLGIRSFLEGDKTVAMAEFTMARAAAPKMAPWAALMQWAVVAPSDRAAATRLLPATDDDPLIRSLLALCREGRGDSVQLPVSHLKPAEACSLLFFSGWNAESSGRREEAAWKLLRCVNTGAREMMQWKAAVDLLVQWGAGKPPVVGYGCELQENGTQGQLLVAAVDAFGAAACQGLQAGDVVTRINVAPASVATWADLPGNNRIGASVRLVVKREGQKRTIWLTSGFEPSPAQGAFAPGAADPFTLRPISSVYTSDIPNGWQPVESASGNHAASRQAAHRFGTGSEVYIGTLRGDVDSLLTAWLRLFGQPPLNAAAKAALPHVKFLEQDAMLLEIVGDYEGLEGPRKGMRMIVVLLAQGDEVVFVRCAGPNQEVAEQRGAFLAFCASVRRAQ